jgi:hypothetical protein
MDRHPAPPLSRATTVPAQAGGQAARIRASVAMARDKGWRGITGSGMSCAGTTLRICGGCAPVTLANLTVQNTQSGFWGDNARLVV